MAHYMLINLHDFLDPLQEVSEFVHTIAFCVCQGLPLKVQVQVPVKPKNLAKCFQFELLVCWQDIVGVNDHV